jgi:hypothetical protein
MQHILYTLHTFPVESYVFTDKKTKLNEHSGIAILSIHLLTGHITLWLYPSRNLPSGDPQQSRAGCSSSE